MVLEENIMEKRFDRNLSNEHRSTRMMILQKQLPENRITDRRPVSENTVQNDVVPDLTDFMNDVFFGTPNSNNKKKAYNLTGRDSYLVVADDNNKNNDDDDGFDSSRRYTDVNNNKARLDDLFDSSRRIGGGFFDEFDYSSSRRRRSVSSSNKSSAQNWLEEAKKIVAQSPPRKSHESSSSSLTGRGSPRFASANQFSPATTAPSGLDRRDPFSRSARRNRPVEGFGGEILSKTAKFTRNNSEINQDHPSSGDASPTSTAQKWFSDTLKPQNTPISNLNYPNVPTSEPTSPKSLIANENLSHFPLRQSTTPRKSRFQNSQIPALTNQPPNSKRTFKSPANLTSSTSSAATNSPTRFDPQILSPPKNLVESSHRRSISSNTCSVPEFQILSPPKNLVESVHRRSISASTCSGNGRILPKSNGNEQFHEEDKTNQDINGYLNEQRTKILKIMSGEMDATAKIVLSGPSNSTSSMVAAIGYSWLLMNRMKADYRSSGDGNETLVVPVMNMRRGKMWNYRQAAWLFQHVGLDANALLFSDEVDLETLMMTKRLSMLVVGEDILMTNGEVGSGCTVLTDNYCEDAYDLLQTPMLKKILLAGILLDTQNLNVYTKSSMTRDAEAIQLLLVGSSPNYRNTLFDELMQDQRDDSFTKVLQKNYGKLPTENNKSKRSPAEDSTPEVKVPNADKSSNESKNGRRNTISPKSGIPTKAPARAPAAKGADPSRGKNGFFLAKWFGFGSK